MAQYITELSEARSPCDSLVIYIVFQNKKSTSSWCWPVLWVFWFISGICSFSGNGFHREASFCLGMRDVPHQCIDLVGWGAFHISPVGLYGTQSWIYCLLCLWENKSLFYYLSCVLGKLARGLYSLVDLIDVWGGVVIAVPMYTLQSFLCRKNKGLLLFSSCHLLTILRFCRQPMYWFL